MTIIVEKRDDPLFISHSEYIFNTLFEQLSDWHYLNFTTDTAIWESKDNHPSTVYIELTSDSHINFLQFTMPQENTESKSRLLGIIKDLQLHLGIKLNTPSSSP